MILARKLMPKSPLIAETSAALTDYQTLLKESADVASQININGYTLVADVKHLDRKTAKNQTVLKTDTLSKMVTRS